MGERKRECNTRERKRMTHRRDEKTIIILCTHHKFLVAGWMLLLCRLIGGCLTTVSIIYYTHTHTPSEETSTRGKNIKETIGVIMIDCVVFLYLMVRLLIIL